MSSSSSSFGGVGVGGPRKLTRSHFNVHPTALISSCDFQARVKAEQSLGLLEPDEALIGLVIGHLETSPGAGMDIVDCCEAKYVGGFFVERCLWSSCCCCVFSVSR